MANDHYVPQFYLRSFSPAGAPGRIFSYHRHTHSKLVGIKSVASSEDYYTIKADLLGLNKRQIDKLFQDMENESAPVLKRLLTCSKLELTADEKEQLSVFFACLANRTPLSQEHFRNMRSAMSLELLKLFAHQKDEFFEQMKQEGFTGTDEELEQFRQHVLGDGIQVKYEEGETDDYFMKIGLEAALVIAPILEQKQWHLLASIGSHVFVTSDHPVTLFRPGNVPIQLGVGFENGHVLIPLSPKQCLVMDDTIFGNLILKVKRERVALINEHIINNAHKAVFANNQSRDIQRIFNRTVLGQNTKVTVLNGL